MVAGPGEQMQPSVSPDGRNLAFIAPVTGRLGTGGIWVKPLEGGAARVVRYGHELSRETAVDAGRTQFCLRF